MIATTSYVFIVHEFELQAASLQGHQQPHCKATGSLTARSQAASLQGHRQPHCKVTGSLTARPQAASLQGHRQPHCKATGSLTARSQAASLQGHKQPHCKAMDRQPHCKATSMHSSRTGRIGQEGQGRHEHRNLYFLGQTLARSLNFSSTRATFITNELLTTSHECAKSPHPYI